MNTTEMTDQQLRDTDTEMMKTALVGTRLMLTDEHRAVKAELGRRAAEQRRKESRTRAGKKGAATRARREDAGIPARRRGFSLDNAPAGGWTDADRVS